MNSQETVCIRLSLPTDINKQLKVLAAQNDMRKDDLIVQLLGKAVGVEPHTPQPTTDEPQKPKRLHLMGE